MYLCGYDVYVYCICIIQGPTVKRGDFNIELFFKEIIYFYFNKYQYKVLTRFTIIRLVFIVQYNNKIKLFFVHCRFRLPNDLH